MIDTDRIMAVPTRGVSDV